MNDLNKKKSSSTSVIAVIVIALLLGFGAYKYMNKEQTPPPPEVAQTEEAPATNEAATPVEEAKPVVVETKKLDIPAVETPPPSASNSDPAIVKMMSARTLGSATAPVKITEYSSLTCSHCGAFHRETFAKFKAEFIDTGKVQMTFKEYPLNAPAMDASQILRCMPEDKFVSFMDLLFQEQDKWAFQNNYKDALRQNAKLAGMSDETFDACLANNALKEAILADMQAANAIYKVQSTPSFVFNHGQKVLVGAQPIEEFEKAVAEASKTPAPAAPAASPAATQETAPEAATDAAVKASGATTEEEAPPAE